MKESIVWIGALLIVGPAILPEAAGHESEYQYAAPGRYFTAVNAHNPGTHLTVIRKTLAVALPHQHPGLVLTFGWVALGRTIGGLLASGDVGLPTIGLGTAGTAAAVMASVYQGLNASLDGIRELAGVDT